MEVGTRTSARSSSEERASIRRRFSSRGRPPRERSSEADLVEPVSPVEQDAVLTELRDLLLDQLNEQIRKGELKTRDGGLVLDLLEEGLVREDGQVLYPVREGIPIMLLSEAISLPGS